VPDSLSAKLSVSEDEIAVVLSDSRTTSVPLAWSCRLSEATPEQCASVLIIRSGEGAHWPDVDEDISVRGMRHGVPARRPPGQ
jgi:hypothetical protein